MSTIFALFFEIIARNFFALLLIIKNFMPRKRIDNENVHVRLLRPKAKPSGDKPRGISPSIALKYMD